MAGGARPVPYAISAKLRIRVIGEARSSDDPTRLVVRGKSDGRIGYRRERCTGSELGEASARNVQTRRGLRGMLAQFRSSYYNKIKVLLAHYLSKAAQAA